MKEAGDTHRDYRKILEKIIKVRKKKGDEAGLKEVTQRWDQSMAGDKSSVGNGSYI